MSLVGPVEQEVLEPGQATLAECAEGANLEHGYVARTTVDLLEHAIRAGEWLNKAREHHLAGNGTWVPWLSEHFNGGPATAQSYMRLARYKDAVLTENLSSVSQASLYLRGLPDTRTRGAAEGTDGFARSTPEVRTAALELRSAGAKYIEISRLLGISPSTAHAWCDPDYATYQRDRSRDRQRARATAQRKEKEDRRELAVKQAVRKQGGAIADAYALGERMQDVIGRAHAEATDTDARRHLGLAGQHYRSMRDEIVRALGVS